MNRVSTLRRSRLLRYIYAQLIIIIASRSRICGGRWVEEQVERIGLRCEHVCGYVFHLSCIIFDVDNIASVVVVLVRQFMVRGFYKDTGSSEHITIIFSWRAPYSQIH